MLNNKNKSGKERKVRETNIEEIKLGLPKWLITIFWSQLDYLRGQYIPEDQKEVDKFDAGWKLTLRKNRLSTQSMLNVSNQLIEVMPTILKVDIYNKQSGTGIILKTCGEKIVQLCVK